MTAPDPRLGALDVWLSRGLAAQPSPRREAPMASVDLVPQRNAAGWLRFAEAIEARDRAAAPGIAAALEARQRAIVADLCDAFDLSAEERASVTAYRGPGNPDALAFLVGDAVVATVAGEPDETGNHRVTVAEGWRHRLRA